MKLSKNQIEILEHTIRNKIYNADKGETDMKALVDLGLMKLVGAPKWQSGEYFTITREGREALIEGE